MHDFKHSRDELLQNFCLFRDNFICNLLRQGQNSLYPIAKTRGHLVIFVLFLQELNRQALPSASEMQVANTYLKCDTGNTKDGLCNRIQLRDVSTLVILREWGTTDFCKDSAIFNRLVHGPLHRSAHHWGVFLQQSFEFMERGA